MIKTVPKSGGFVTKLYGIAYRGRLLRSRRSPKFNSVPGVYDTLEDAGKDAEYWTNRFGKKHSAVPVEVEYKWKVKK